MFVGNTAVPSVPQPAGDFLMGATSDVPPAPPGASNIGEEQVDTFEPATGESDKFIEAQYHAYLAVELQDNANALSEIAANLRGLGYPTENMIGAIDATRDALLTAAGEENEEADQCFRESRDYRQKSRRLRRDSYVQQYLDEA
jgi:hypothetical protein